MSKISNGLCDNLLVNSIYKKTSICRCYNEKKRKIICPAMNTEMYDHPITEIQIKQLIAFKYEVIYPICKELACGTFGIANFTVK